MESIGIGDFKNLIHDGSLVDLSQTTIDFCKLVLAFTNDFFKIYTPDAFVVFIECFCDIFKKIIELFTDALSRDENVPMTDSIQKDALFVSETVLPAMCDRINKETGLVIHSLVELSSM